MRKMIILKKEIKLCLLMFEALHPKGKRYEKDKHANLVESQIKVIQKGTLIYKLYNSCKLVCYVML